ncbi:MAG: HDIG domain-containing metalloprotein [Candidatus Omnitrophota bacterium]
MKKLLINNIFLSLIFIGLVVIFVWPLNLDVILSLLLITIYFYLKMSKQENLLEKTNFLHLLLLFVLMLASIETIYSYKISAYWIPIVGIIMLVTILFRDLELGLLLTLISSIFTGIIYSNINLTIILLITGIFTSLLSYNAKKRSQIIKAGVLAGCIQVVCIIFMKNFNFNTISTREFLVPLLNGLLSGFLVSGVLPIFEYLFGVMTNISLLELSDFNHPLLKKMILEAPGTYHHSLIVGNLAETATEAVGANPLLARVGAYYHDIGKLEKPEYFSENQKVDQSKHTNLSPSMSKLVIMNHVKDGMELAKKYKLNPRLIDFIEQHHGTSLVYCFYRRALEGLETEDDIKEEGFRYPGPKPKTKEAAIVLLADSVEAASRAIDSPTAAKIEDVVHKIINNKFIDGQLDLCDLTLKDLEKIANIFSHILTGIYHGRVEYPEQKQNNHKKSSKQNSSSSEQNKKHHSENNKA